MKKTFLLFILFAGGVVFAQSVYIGPIVGYNKGKNTDATTTISGAVRVSIASFGIEGSVGYTTSKFTGGDVEAKNYPIMLTFMMHPLPIVYGQAGIGWYNTKLEFSGPLKTLGFTDETKSNIGYHIGFGAELPLGNILLTGDVKYVFLDYDLGTISGLSDSKANFTLVSVGLLFKL
jgi:hypothetical protein